MQAMKFNMGGKEQVDKDLLIERLAQDGYQYAQPDDCLRTAPHLFAYPNGILTCSHDVDHFEKHTNPEYVLWCGEYRPVIDQPIKVVATPDPMTVQVGGSHYKGMAIQPMQYSMANGFDALQHTIIKYVSRFRNKNGIEDLRKARHAIDMLIAHEENNANT